MILVTISCTILQMAFYLQLIPYFGAIFQGYTFHLISKRITCPLNLNWLQNSNISNYENIIQ